MKTFWRCPLLCTSILLFTCCFLAGIVQAPYNADDTAKLEAPTPNVTQVYFEGDSEFVEKEPEPWNNQEDANHIDSLEHLAINAIIKIKGGLANYT